MTNRKIVDINHISNELKELLNEKYPDGFKYVEKIKIKQGGKEYYTVELKTEDCCYLVKIDARIDYGLNDDNY